MKKIIALFLTLSLALCGLSFAAADDPNEAPGTVTMPYSGLRFVPPTEFQNAKGAIVTDGDFELSPGSGIQYAYWLYCAMPAEKVYEASNDPNAPIIVLFYVFTIGDGMNFDDMNAMLGNSLQPECARELGKVGDYTFYLYAKGADQNFANSLDASYREDYITVANLTDQIAAGFSCFEPTERPDPYAALVGTKVEFTTTDLNGNPVSSADLFAQNEITMINIWATWCGPCVGELAELQQINERLKNKNCAIIGMLTDNDLDSAKQLVAENGVAYPVVLAPANVGDLFSYEYIPTSYFVDSNGIILASPIIGADVSSYENTIDSLLTK